MKRPTRLKLCLLASALFLSLQVAAQAGPGDRTILTFDVVSIKPNHSGSPMMFNKSATDGYSVENMILRYIIADAFGVRADLISGIPGWVDNEHYDLTAKVAGADLKAYDALSKTERDQMLQAVLKDRFRLSARIVTKQLPGYTLTIAKSGFKLRSVSDDKPGGSGANDGDIDAEATTIVDLSHLLSLKLEKNVVDRTGLTGRYTFRLRWASDRATDSSPMDGTSGSDGLPSLPTALEEQLGLRLVPAKVETATLVIDHIEHPSDN